MAGEDSALAEAKPGQQSTEGQETGQAEGQATNQQTEHHGQQGTSNDRPLPPSPPLPPRPLPVPRGAALNEKPLPHPLPHPLPPNFIPLPIQQGSEPPEVERPHYPVWHRAKIVFGILSLLVSAVIFGIGITLAIHNAPYYDYYDYWVPADIEMGTSGAAAGLAIVATTLEFLTICLSSRRRGMHPGLLVTFHLFIWLVALTAIILVSLFNTDYSYYYYNYPKAELNELSMQSSMYEQVLLGFDCLLLCIHFILFIGACVETNRLELTKKKTIVVRVPVYGGLRPGAQGVQYPPPPMMSQVPPQRGQDTSPVPPQVAALYGGYYAPAPPAAAWTPSQQQGNHGMPQGYYAPVQGAAGTTPMPYYYQQQPAPAVASSSGSRRSQRRSQGPPQLQTQSATRSPEGQQGQTTSGEPAEARV